MSPPRRMLLPHPSPHTHLEQDPEGHDDVVEPREHSIGPPGGGDIPLGYGHVDGVVVVGGSDSLDASLAPADSVNIRQDSGGSSEMHK